MEASTATVPQAKPNVLKSIGESPWWGFLGRRLLSLICIMVALVIIVFFMLRLVPGDPVISAFGADTPPSQIERIRHEFGLDKPLLDQLKTYVGNVAQGDLGRGYATNEPVSTVIKERIGPSVQLAGAALVIVLVGGLSIGMLAAAWTRDGRHPRSEVLFGGATSMTGAVPDYVWGTILIFVFAVTLGWLPASGSGSFSSLILPALALALPLTASVSRIVRIETLNVLAQDYTRTARGERIPARRIYLRHVLPNVLTATLTIGGLIFAGLIGGAVVVETVFGRPGLGTALVTAVTAKDYAVVQGITLVLGFTVVVINTIVDILLGVLDPRTLTKQQ